MAKYKNIDLQWHPAWGKMLGAKPDDSFVSNGNTNAPDIIFGIDTRPAAHFHDGAYSIEGGGTEPQRFQADQLYRYNLASCGIIWFLAPIRFFYYFRLRVWGHKFYTYADGEEPKVNLRFLLRLCFGRYLR